MISSEFIHKSRIPFILVVAAAGIFVFSPLPAHASFWSDIVNGVRNVFSSPISSKPSIVSDISLVASGDLNKNGKIDSGDTVRFSFTITNPTKDTYRFSDLRTNIQVASLNEFSDLQGAVSLRENKGQIDIPNFTLLADQVRKVSFEAKVNFSKDTDIILSTRPELVDEHLQEIVQGAQESVTAIKMDKETFDKTVRSGRN